MYEFLNRLFLESAPLIIGFVTTGLGYLVGKFREQTKEARKDSEAIKKGILALLKTNLKKEYSEYTKANCISPDNLVDVKQKFEAYHELGGNGVVEELYNEVINLRRDRNQHE